ncbi:MAG: ATPase [Planctomycetes bacterium]|nr:ATPase [Planctomycetota bacterium]
MRTPDSSRALAFARARHAARRWVDTYRPIGKLHPAICTQCGASEWRGRWRWGEAPPDLAPVICPACSRMRDNAPAHMVELSGGLPRWWSEVRGIVANVERAEVREHPMERVMRIEVGDDRVRIPTTGLHVARRLVAALVRRFRRDVRVRFDEGVTTIEW